MNNETGAQIRPTSLLNVESGSPVMACSVISGVPMEP